MSAAERKALAALQALAAGLEGALARAFLRVLDTIRDARTLEQLAAAVASGGGEAVVALLLDVDTETAATTALTRGLVPAVVATGLVQGAQAPTLRRLVVELKRNGFPEAEAAARTLAVDRYRTLRAELIDGLRATVADGIARGVNPREVARELRASVGLTDYDRTLVASFRAQLTAGDSAVLGRQLRDRRYDALVRRIQQGGTADPAMLERAVAAYQRRLLHWRAETWARTAALDATRTGKLAAWQAAIDRGVITGAIVKRWVTRLDGRERESHRAANGQTVPWGAPFRTSKEGAVQVPGERAYNCRCSFVVVSADLADLLG